LKKASDDVQESATKAKEDAKKGVNDALDKAKIK
jgi:hypothetical protein